MPAPSHKDASSRRLPHFGLEILEEERLCFAVCWQRWLSLCHEKKPLGVIAGESLPPIPPGKEQNGYKLATIR